MRRTLAVACALASLSACQLAGQRERVLAPLDQDGEVFVYLEAFQGSASRVSFMVDGLTAERQDGVSLPLEVTLHEVSGPELRGQRLLAWARLPPGDYTALVLKVSRATLQGEEERGHSDLLLPAEPTRIAAPLRLARGEGKVLSLALQFGSSVQKGFAFTPSFTASVEGTPVTPLTGYCSNTAHADVTVFDKHGRRALGDLPVGREPQGFALDVVRGRAYVALAGEDAVQVLDLLAGTELNRVALRAGDRPRELGLTSDGRLLVVTNANSNSVSFVDPISARELDRVNVGQEPSALLIDRSSRRAYVANRRSSSVTVLDLPTHAVVTTFATDALPSRVQLNRAGTRLYVAQAGSAYVNIYSLPDNALLKRVFVGVGAAALKVDPRSDLIYVGKADETIIQVFDPFALMPVNSIELPEGTSYLTIDDVENTLLALMPERRAVAFVDLTTRRVVGAVDVGRDPFILAVVGERN
jgi:YVTN family beta-propeller protein